MNVVDANYVISALNHVAQLVTALAKDVESQAWEGFEDHAGMSGVRPIAAAQLSEPDFEAAAQPLVVEEAAPPGQPVPVMVEVSLVQVRSVLAGLSQQGLTRQVRELIQACGAGKLSDVDPSKYGWLLAQAKGLSDA